MSDEAIFPIINGGRGFDFASIRFNIAQGKFKGVTSIDYGDALDPGEARGTSPVSFGTTTGESKPDGSIEMHKASFQKLIELLGDGYGTKEFNIIVAYAMFGMPTITDELVRCRIKKARDNPKQGNAPPTVKVDLYITDVLRNGISIVPKDE